MKIATLSDGTEITLDDSGCTVALIIVGPDGVIDSIGADVRPDIGNPIERAVNAWATENGLTVEGEIHDPIKASFKPGTTY